MRIILILDNNNARTHTHMPLLSALHLKQERKKNERRGGKSNWALYFILSDTGFRHNWRKFEEYTSQTYCMKRAYGKHCILMETSIALHYYSMFNDKNVCLYIFILSKACFVSTQVALNDDVNWEMGNTNTSRSRITIQCERSTAKWSAIANFIARFVFSCVI